MELFTVDTAGDKDLLNANQFDSADTEYFSRGFTVENIDDGNLSDGNDDEDDEDEKEYDYGGLPPPSVDVIEILRKPSLYHKSLYGGKATKKSTKYNELEAFCKAMGWTNTDSVVPSKPAEGKGKKSSEWIEEDVIDLADVHENLTKTDVRKELANSCTKGIEKQRALEILSDRKAAKLRKAEREKTKGQNWFNMPATEITEELRQDMEIIQMRSVLNPTHFYKKNDLKTLPKYFQVGTVLPSALDRYNDRGTRVNKKKSLVDELLEDAQFQQFNKRKYNEVMAEKSKSGYRKAYKKMKKSKKKS